MSEESCKKGCVPVNLKKKTCLPNLVSAAEVLAGVRDCRGRTPFNVRWCYRTNGWPPGSMVHTECGYFFTLSRALGNPKNTDSEWIQFDFEFLFRELLEKMSCEESCPVISNDVIHWDPDETNVASIGETWCFSKENADGEVSYVFACAKEDDLIKSPMEKPLAWTATKTPQQLMCGMLEEPALQKMNNIIDNKDGTFSWVSDAGLILLTWHGMKQTFNDSLVKDAANPLKLIHTSTSGVITSFYTQPDPDCLPRGGITVAESVPGFLKTIFSDDNVVLTNTDFVYFEALKSELVLKVSDYPCLAIVGTELNVTVDVHLGYAIHAAWARPNAQAASDYYPNDNANYTETPQGYLESVQPYQWTPIVSIDGAVKSYNSDRYGLNLSGYNAHASSTRTFDIMTTGVDIVLSVVQHISAATSYPGNTTTPIRTQKDFIGIDTADITATFMSI